MNYATITQISTEKSVPLPLESLPGVTSGDADISEIVFSLKNKCRWPFEFNIIVLFCLLIKRKFDVQSAPLHLNFIIKIARWSLLQMMPA